MRVVAMKVLKMLCRIHMGKIFLLRCKQAVTVCVQHSWCRLPAQVLPIAPQRKMLQDTANVFHHSPETFCHNLCSVQEERLVRWLPYDSIEAPTFDG